MNVRSGADREIEAKFLVRDPTLFRTLGRIQTLGPFHLSRRRRELQRNTYLDTADFKLKKHRAALKVRQVGAKAEVTFKQEKGYRRGVSERVEVSTALPKRQVGRLLQGGGALQAVLTLSTGRTRLFFRLGPEEIELDLDRVGVLQRGRVIATHLEVELENRNASPSAYRAALEALKARYPGKLEPSRLSKYALGLRALRRSR